MKRHNQVTGIRKWAGEDMIELQAEPLKAIDAFFAEYDPCIIKGCEVTAAGAKFNISPGIVSLAGKDHTDQPTQMVVPFAGVNDVTLPVYLTLAHTVDNRPYMDGEVKPVSYAYYAKASTVAPAAGVPFLKITASGSTRFVDVLQDEKHRFLSDQFIATLLTDAPNDGQVYGRRSKSWSTVDSFEVGEIRRFLILQPFSNPKYLPTDGSQVNPLDYPDLVLNAAINFTTATAIVSGFSPDMIGFHNGKYWAYGFVSPNYRIYSSSDGINWEQKFTQAAGSLQGGNFYGFAANGNELMFVVFIRGAGATSRAYYSTNGGDTWTYRADLNIPGTTHDIFEKNMFALGYLNGKWTMIASSFSGIDTTALWEATTPSGKFTERKITDGFPGYAKFIENLLIINVSGRSELGIPARIVISTDGINFTEIPTDITLVGNTIKVNGRILSNGGATYSDDGGVTWQTRSIKAGGVMATNGSDILSFVGNSPRLSKNRGDSWETLPTNAPFTPAWLFPRGQDWLLSANTNSIMSAKHFLPNIPNTTTEKAYIKVLK